MQHRALVKHLTKGPFNDYVLGVVGKIEGGNRNFWGMRMGGPIFLRRVDWGELIFYH